MELLERDAPLRCLSDCLREAREGVGRVALVSGEAGIGKTALVESFLAAHRAEARLLLGRCDALFTPEPLAPLHDVALQTNGALLQLMQTSGARLAIFSAVIRELQSGDQATVLVFEDVHWADDATLDLLKYLGRRIRAAPTLIILTYRDDESDAGHALWSLLGNLPAEAIRRVAVAPLTEAAVARLARHAGRSAAGVHAQTGGNPFYVTELLASPSGSVPTTVREATLARAMRLSPAARAVLDLCSADPADARGAIAAGRSEQPGSTTGARRQSIDAWLDPPGQAPFAAAPDLQPQAATPTNGWPFTTSRVFPKEELLSYPYTAIGRITFEDSAGNSHACSGAVIQLRLVLTAGHCVYDDENEEWYKNWVFYPQYYDGLSPLGAWATLQALTTSQWIDGGLPNPGDFAILVMVDQAKPIGQMTGWLGWRAGTFGEHFHQFGYPGNLDRGQRPQETTAAVAAVLGNHFRWGTNQTFGSSGGPLIINFGENGLGQDFPNNQVIGVVSFGSPSAGYAASSKMRANFVRLFRAACNLQPRNCTSAPTEATIASR